MNLWKSIQTFFLKSVNELSSFENHKNACKWVIIHVPLSWNAFMIRHITGGLWTLILFSRSYATSAAYPGIDSCRRAQFTKAAEGFLPKKIWKYSCKYCGLQTECRLTSIFNQFLGVSLDLETGCMRAPLELHTRRLGMESWLFMHITNLYCTYVVVY